MHPLSIIVSQLEELFLGMGYQIAEGPEVESDYFNFELMNLPKDILPEICKILLY